MRWQAAYHAGRLVTYATLGAALALAGRLLGQLFPAVAVGSILQLVLGASLIVAAALLVLRGRAVRAPGRDSLLGRLLARAVTNRRAWGSLTLGLLTGFLPCGVLYAAFGLAVAASSPAQGGWLMLAFWLGTAPLLFAVGLLSGGLLRALRPAVATVLVAVVLVSGGTWLVAKGWRGLSDGPRATNPHLHHGAIHSPTRGGELAPG